MKMWETELQFLHFIVNILFFRDHMKHVHNIQPIGPKCQFCDKTFSKLSYLYTHCNRVHPKEVAKKWCQCLTCNLCLPDVVTLRNHVAQVIKYNYICCNVLKKLSSLVLYKNLQLGCHVVVHGAWDATNIELAQCLVMIYILQLWCL